MNSVGTIYRNKRTLPWDVIFCSSILILLIATVILTLWGGGGSILRKKRKLFFYLTIAMGWVLISFISPFMTSSGRALNIVGIFPILVIILPIFSVFRAFSLIRWGKQIETGKDLPDYLKNQNATALKKSGIYLYGVIGILLAVNIIYGINYQNQSVKFSEEIQSFIQTDPSSFQKMCQSFSNIP